MWMNTATLYALSKLASASIDRLVRTSGSAVAFAMPAAARRSRATPTMFCEMSTPCQCATCGASSRPMRATPQPSSRTRSVAFSSSAAVTWRALYAPVARSTDSSVLPSTAAIAPASVSALLSQNDL